MEVILLARIEKLGQMGDVVKVKPGYARNFLLPQNKAVSATSANKEHYENQRKQFDAQNLERKKEAEAIGGKLHGNFIVLVRQAGEGGQLYGSVSARDLANGVIGIGYNINRTQVSLERPIKTVGLHTVKIALHPEVMVTVTANVARSEEEAAIQEKTGEAVVSSNENEESLVQQALSEPDIQEAPPDQGTPEKNEAFGEATTKERSEDSTPSDPT